MGLDELPKNPAHVFSTSMNLLRKLSVMVWMICLCSFAQSQIEHAQLIKPLIDPVKLATLKERGANQRGPENYCDSLEGQTSGTGSSKSCRKCCGIDWLGKYTKSTTHCGGYGSQSLDC
jgi:hypothetical protein